MLTFLVTLLCVAIAFAIKAVLARAIALLITGVHGA
jgi:hypothetical protein